MSRRASAPLTVCIVTSLVAGIGLTRTVSAPTPAPSDASTPLSPVEQAEIQIVGFDFVGRPPVRPGQEVSVRNDDGVAHTLTAIDGAFDTGDMAGGTILAVTAPSEPGVYDFICTIHPSMTGSLTVTG